VLDFYSVLDLEGWPEDIPSSANFLGSLDLDEFRLCVPALAGCSQGPPPSFSSDWVLSTEDVLKVADCFEKQQPGSGSDLTPSSKMLAILTSARGFGLLAVCD
jgi:hypothetical protein